MAGSSPVPFPLWITLSVMSLLLGERKISRIICSLDYAEVKLLLAKGYDVCVSSVDWQFNASMA